MKCEEDISGYCREKIASNKVFNYEICEKCCLGCKKYQACKDMCKELRTELNISQEG